MSIEFLRALAERAAPATPTHPGDVDNLLVLRAAGLVAALTLKLEPGGREVGRFRALTPNGGSALGTAATDGSTRAGQAAPRVPQ